MVECKKAQPKEVMLPANLAKTRAAGRGAYGELLMLNPAGHLGPGAMAASSAAAAALRYAPYPIPVSLPGPSIPVAHIAVTPATQLHYASALYDLAGCKRVFAAPAAALRPMAHHRAPPTLTYSMNDLLGVQGLDLNTVYAHNALGL
ncbi:unnamed protein product [Brassicogethes aeneus]|uniref:Uncharacterized protein n=1 Tax=Brassicogethes aeneus TaxID=1431903 RepID=A0A9P0FHM6_BRAAE|nr:unnamed protein product [Brassicogethes aeneus]